MPLPANERILSGAGFHDTHENIKNAGNLAVKPEVAFCGPFCDPSGVSVPTWTWSPLLAFHHFLENVPRLV